MKPGDLVLYSSDVSIMRTILRFTHVGVIVAENRVLEMHGAADRGTEDLENYFVGGRPTGPKVYDLRARIAAYPGRIWIAPLLRRRGTDVIDPSAYRDLEYYEAYVSYYLRSCVANRWLGSACRRSTTSVFCTEFVGMVLRDMGVDVGDVGCLTPSALASLPVFENPQRLSI